MFLCGIDQVLSFEIPVPLQPLACFHDFERIGAGNKYLTQQRIGIERNRRYKVVELLGRPCLLRRRLCPRLRFAGGVLLLLHPEGHSGAEQRCYPRRNIRTMAAFELRFMRTSIT